MPGWEARVFVSVPGCSIRLGRSPPVPGRGDSFRPVRYRFDDRHCHGRSRARSREFLVVARLLGGDRGQTPYVEKAPQLLVTGGVVRSVHRPVVLVEELLVLSFGEVSQDHQRIGGIFRRLCGHMIQLTLAYRAQTAAAARSSAIVGQFAPGAFL